MTLYVEPEEATPLNNREMELAGREAEEETRILRELSSQVRAGGQVAQLLQSIPGRSGKRAV